MSQISDFTYEIDLQIFPFSAYFDSAKCVLHFYNEKLIKIKSLRIKGKVEEIRFQNFHKILVQTSEASTFSYQNIDHLEYHAVTCDDDPLQIDENLSLYKFNFNSIFQFFNPYNDYYKHLLENREGNTKFLQIPHIGLIDSNNTERFY